MEKEKKQNKLIIVLVAIIIILVFALGFVLGTKNNNVLERNKEKPVKETNNLEKNKKEDESSKKELTEKDAKELLSYYNIDSNTIANYSINNKLEVTYKYLLEHNNYKEETCKVILKNELNSWEHRSYKEYEYYELFEGTDNYYYCNGNSKYYVIPYSDYVDALKKLFAENMRKDYWEYYYVKDSDSIIFLPYRDGTEGPSVAINKINSIKEENNIIEIEYYAEKVSCEDYDYDNDTYKNCGKENFKVSGLNKEVEQQILDKHLSNINLYKITFIDNGDYKTFKSIKKQ